VVGPAGGNPSRSRASTGARARPLAPGGVERRGVAGEADQPRSGGEEEGEERKRVKRRRAGAWVGRSLLLGAGKVAPVSRSSRVAVCFPFLSVAISAPLSLSLPRGHAVREENPMEAGGYSRK
jgi:hypothetical protein